MGGAVSTGADNSELVDNLVEADYIKSPLVERVFRAVDRADYYLEGHRESAYKDLAWKHGHLHLSAPCIYSEVLESLQLEPGMSFLNLGSGTGYLSTMAGLIIGPYGINHGVELYPDVVDYARARLEDFRKNSDTFDEFEVCEPVFTVGNCLNITSICRQYDRVYCGAAVLKEHENYMKNLINVGGLLVMPLHDQLLQVRRTSATNWYTKCVLPVSFATLVSPTKEDDMIDLPEVGMPILQDICRITVRDIVRTNILSEFPHLKNVRKKKRPIVKKRSGKKQRRVNIVPMSMGMMILGQFEDSDEDGGVDSMLRRRRRFLRGVALGAPAARDDEDGDDDNDNHDDDDDDDDDEIDMDDDHTEVLSSTTVEENDDEEREINENNETTSRTSGLSRIAEFLTKSDDDEMSDEESDEGVNVNNETLPDSEEVAATGLTPPRKIRCSSNTSADTSETSGMGSLGEDPLEGDSDKISSGSSVDSHVPSTMECADQGPPRETVRTIMRERIESLPLPISMKTYLMYYRN